ncbi:hypothetical protein [Blastococcus sp. TF02A-30]|uniref:hypothetical protein n=1 Tax=Blastococcus sp. TF02A-30 TaxID=2250580 RepID=UPI000DEA6F55|nr:hypothetical protein [Blastococcus sp. TF02A-30]RBY85699.1 hypothetical protein DQ241_15520 [Blastococcus sp. TF02A-30]
MRRTVPWLVALVGAALLVAGVVVFAVAGHPPERTFFSGSYEPLAELDSAYRSSLTLGFDSAVLWSRGQLVGAGLAMVGLLVLTGLAGWLLGRRTRR